MIPEITIEALRIMAQGAGLNLGDEELRRLLPGVNRARKQAGELREIIGAPDEPAVAFASGPSGGEIMIAADDLFYSTIGEIAAALRRKEVSSIEITDALLERIEALDGKLHSFITVTADLARQQARQAEQELRSGANRGPLHGIPIALKDLYMTKDIRTTCHSAVLENLGARIRRDDRRQTSRRRHHPARQARHA